MLNVAPGMYQNRDDAALPIPLIKEIIIFPSEMEDGEQKQKTIKLQLKIILQNIRNVDSEPFSLHVSAIQSQTYMKIIKMDKERNGIRSLIQGSQSNQALSKNIPLGYSKNNMSPFLYSPGAPPVYNQTILVPLTVKYTDKLDYLCVVAATNSVSSEGKKGGTPQGKKLKVSRPVIETVFLSGRPPLHTNIFRLAQAVGRYGIVGDVWGAPVHRRSPKQLMVGAYHSVDAHPAVDSIKVPNLKIKDYRVFSVNDFLQIDKGPMDNLKKSKKQQRNAYISELSFSRAPDNAVKIFFSFDLGQFVEHNADLSYLFKNSQSLLSTAQIEGIKVYREAIDQESMGNRLTTTGGAPPNNSCTASERTEIASLSAGTVKVLHAARSASPNIYEMLACDVDMANVSPGGSYAYSVEIEIVDNSASAVKKMISRLRAKMVEFDEYLLKFFNYNKKKYDPQTYVTSFLTDDKGSEKWRAVLIEYASSLVFLRGHSIGQFDVTSILKNFMALVDPSAASAESLLMFQKIINQYIFQLEKTVGTPTVGGSTAPQSYNSKLGTSSARRRRVHFRSTSQQLYFNDARSDAGFDYLGADFQEMTRNFGQITAKEYRDRISKEVEKYEVPDPSSPTINKFGFLSPDSVKTPTGDIRSQRNMDFIQSLDLLHANTAPLSKHRSFIGSPSLLDRRNVQIEEILHTEGVSYERKNIKLRDLISETTPAAQSVVDVTEYVPSTSEFASTYSATEAQEGDSTLRHRAVIRGAHNQIGEVPLVQNLVSEAAQGFKPATPVNVYKVDSSLAGAELRNTGRRSARFSRINIFEKNINFNSIVKVEYLAGYNRRIGIKDPNWLPLDKAALDGIEKGRRPLLCRLSSAGRNLNVKNRFKLPNYNSFFVVGPTGLNGRDITPQFEKTINSLRQQLNNTIMGSILNIKAAGDRVLTEYTCSDGVIYTPSASTTRRRAPGTAPSEAPAPIRTRRTRGNY